MSSAAPAAPPKRQPTEAELALIAEAEWKPPKLTIPSVVLWAPGPNSREWDTLIVVRVMDRSVAGLRLHYAESGYLMQWKSSASYHRDPMVARLPERVKRDDAGVWKESDLSQLVSVTDILLAAANTLQQQQARIEKLNVRLDGHEQSLVEISKWLEVNGPHVKALREKAAKADKATADKATG